FISRKQKQMSQKKKLNKLPKMAKKMKKDDAVGLTSEFPVVEETFKPKVKIPLTKKANNILVTQKMNSPLIGKRSSVNLKSKQDIFGLKKMDSITVSFCNKLTPQKGGVCTLRLYVTGLASTVTDKDLMNSFVKAKSVHIAQTYKGNKPFRIGHIFFTNEDDVDEELAVKNRRINDAYVHVTKDSSTIRKRPLAQGVDSSPAKRAKVCTVMTTF
ncbi:hypothetical protein Hamer_G010127, partial [Homarus americanus]